MNPIPETTAKVKLDKHHELFRENRHLDRGAYNVLEQLDVKVNQLKIRIEEGIDNDLPIKEKEAIPMEFPSLNSFLTEEPDYIRELNEAIQTKVSDIAGKIALIEDLLF